jgi:hypothetical protein
MYYEDSEERKRNKTQESERDLVRAACLEQLKDLSEGR